MTLQEMYNSATAGQQILVLNGIHDLTGHNKAVSLKGESSSTVIHIIGNFTFTNIENCTIISDDDLTITNIKNSNIKCNILSSDKVTTSNITTTTANITKSEYSYIRSNRNHTNDR